MLLASWNLNSIRAREERLLAWLERRQPDVVCLQELKCTEDQFPFEAIEAAGYQAIVHGQKTYNGVAILSTSPQASAMMGTNRRPA
jgi:exodeoxyribonuclease-3